MHQAAYCARLSVYLSHLAAICSPLLLKSTNLSLLSSSSLLQKWRSPPTIAGARESGEASQKNDDYLCYQCSNRQINPALTTTQLAALLARL